MTALGTRTLDNSAPDVHSRLVFGSGPPRAQLRIAQALAGSPGVMRYADSPIGDDNVVHGRVAISSTARLSGCVLHGPVSVDDGAVIEDSYVGPYTAVGAGAILIGAEIDNTMVLAGAEITHPGQRIEGSIIGERASVVRSFALPRGLHMRLEPQSRVTLS